MSRGTRALAAGVSVFLAACLAAGLTAAADGPGPGTAARAAAATAFSWQPAGIPVESEGALPFYGGLASGDRGAKPRLADLDADGDLDLFALDKDGRIATYRNDGDARDPRFVPAGDDLLGVPLTDWFLFADIDGDGDLDLLGGAGPEGEAIALFENNGSPGAAAFGYVASPAFLDSAQVIPRLGNTPAFEDLDADGDLDIFYVMPDQGIGGFHENVGNRKTPLFGSQVLGYGGLNTFVDIGGKAPPGEKRHGASFPTFLDVDADADLDLYIGDLYNANVWLFRNNGGPDSAEFARVSDTALALPFDTVFTNLVWTDDGDLDGDGLADLVVAPSGDAGRLPHALFLFGNVGRPDSAAFAFASDAVLSGIDLGVRAYPALADLDGDGDQDLVVSHQAETGEPGLVLFENVGTAGAPAFRRVTAASPLEEIVHDSLDTPSPAFADMDADGDLDALVGQAGLPRQVFYFENAGTAAAADFTYRGTLLDPVRTNFRRRPDGLATPTVGDLDGDGDLDLMVGEFGTSGNPKIYLYRNVGLGGELAGGASAAGARGMSAGRRLHGVPQFEWVTSNADSAFGFDTAADTVTGYLAPVLIDTDGDGLVDLVVGSEDGRLRLYRGTGRPDSLRFAAVPGAFAGIDVGRASAPAIADIDADGDLDLIVGEENGGVNFYQAVSPGALAASIQAAPLGDSAIAVSWTLDPGSDAEIAVLRTGEMRAAVTVASVAAPAPVASAAVDDGRASPLYPGNTYAYRLALSFRGESGSRIATTAGPAIAFLPLPSLIVARSAVAREGDAGVRVSWRVSRPFAGLAFRLARQDAAGEFSPVAGAESLAVGGDSASVLDAEGSESDVYRLEALYRRAGVLAAMPDTLFRPVLLSAIRFRAHPPRPNPFGRGGVSFVLDLPEDAEAALCLFDVSGRRVREIRGVRLAAGAGRALSWDGKDDDGIEVPAGVYLYRLDAGGRVVTGRTVRVR